MEQEVRDSGIEPLGRIPWRTHVCHFYDSKNELLEIMVPYIRAGLQSNECCLWICSEPVCEGEAFAALREVLPGLERFTQTGQLEVVRFDSWYLRPDGLFEPEHVLRNWKRKLAQAISAGYQGVRAAGNTSFVENTIWREFIQYEELIPRATGNGNILFMCSYPSSMKEAPQVVDVIKNHQYALVKRELGWDLVECGRYWELEWESLFDEIEEGILVVGERGEILAANRVLLDCFRVRGMRDLGKDLDELAARFKLRPEHSDRGMPVFQVLGTGNRRSSWRATIPEVRESIELTIRARTIRATSYFPNRYLLQVHDVTESRRLERMKDRFVQVMGHELKNPIQVMKALVPLLTMMETPEISVIRRYANTLNAQITELSSLIEDLLTACVAEGRELLILRRPIDLVDLVGDWASSQLSVKGHEVIKLFSTSGRVPVSVDSKRIRGILANVFGNAVKYSPEGTRIWIDIKVRSGSALVIIEDEGVGIQDSEMELVFQAFYRGSNIDKTDVDGVGIGLFISKKVARQHGGDLWAEHREGGGTRIVLRLPLLENQAELISALQGI